MTKQVRTRTIIAERPAAFPPEHWAIFNAPRPIYGHVTWTGDFCSGVFYTAILVTHEDCPKLWELNRQQDAVLLTYVTEEDAFQEGKKLMLARYPDEEGILDHPAQRSWVIDRFLTQANHGKDE